ncbi:MAG: ATP-binding protein [Planctomycetes bacterium]|nr:ATP-binding protein [Planctomycetota bacterium]
MASMTRFRKVEPWRAEVLFARGCDLHDGLRRVADLLVKLDAFLAGVPGLTAAGAADLRLVCDEIASNLVRHACPHTAVRLAVEAETTEASVRLRLLDDGNAFNPFDPSLPEPSEVDLEQRRIGGLGLFLVRQLFPEARYARSRGQNIAEVEYRLSDTAARDGNAAAGTSLPGTA